MIMRTGDSTINRDRIRELFKQQQLSTYPIRYQGVLYWIEPRRDTNSHCGLVKYPGEFITSAEFDISTKVHEYGGNCFAFSSGRFLFNNKVDSRIYCQNLDDPRLIRPVTSENKPGSLVSSYADFEVFDHRRKLIFVREEIQTGDQENKNSIAWVPLEIESPVEVTNLVENSDFVSSPRISPDGKMLAWLSWNHPDMPWDSSYLMVGDLNISSDEVSLTNVRSIAGGEDSSVCQLNYLADGRLCFAMDKDTEDNSFENYWNLYLWSAENGVQCLTQDMAEYGAPHWIFGERRWIELASSRIVAIRTMDYGDELVEISSCKGVRKLEGIDYSRIEYLSGSECSNGTELLFIGSSYKTESELVRYDVIKGQAEVIKKSNRLFSYKQLSKPRSVWFNTRDGENAHAFIYSSSVHCSDQTGSKAPAMVFIHGGPTSRCYPVLDSIKQYWLSLGFTLLDVNHRGSSGFGRKFRNKLRGRWGEIDVQDVADAIKFLVQNGYASKDKVCIRGKSAGGYAVLQLITNYPGMFRVAISYYGIGSLATLAETTHKFESRYLDYLLGEEYCQTQGTNRDSVYYQRSPIHKVAEINCALIMFQGLNDKIVAPEVSKELAKVVKAKGCPIKYIEYENEGHGFRQMETKVDSVEQETKFVFENM